MTLSNTKKDRVKIFCKHFIYFVDYLDISVLVIHGAEPLLQQILLPNFKQYGFVFSYVLPKTTEIEKLDYKLLLLKIQVFYMTQCCLEAEDNSLTECDAALISVC